LVACLTELGAQITKDVYGHSRCLEQSTKVRFPHAGADRPSQIVAQVKFPNRLLRHPWPLLLQSDFSVSAIGGLRRDTASHNSADSLGVAIVPIVSNEGETSSFQLIEIPEIAGTAILAQAHDKKIIAPAFDQNSLVVIGQHPYVASPVGGLVVSQCCLFDLLWADAEEMCPLLASDDLVPLK
jgi:hypothetical protein